jgi:alkylation response protein AidB-like acyl-CoA dehydrogenase
MNHRSVSARARPADEQEDDVDFSLTPEQEAFREQVRSWLADNMPRDWTRRVMASSDVPRPEAYQLLREWQRRLYDAGFIGLTWPKEYGGRSLTFMEELILHEEMALAKAPPILNILGVGMAGPTIIAYGTEEQKQRYPAKILSCEEIWCQGYSEPNSGSDLAALQTRAVKDGDHYVINGQKVWTSLAHIADYMMLLARTDPDAPKHKGITYFLLDMKLPGVTVKPLRQITGDPEFNEVFFDNVRVHESQVLGGVNNGWQVGLTTLMYERLALGFGLQVRLRIGLDGLIELARRVEKTGRVVTRDPVMRQKLAQLWIDTECLKYTGARAITKLLKGEIPGPEASTGKMIWVETHQKLQELSQDIQGPYGQLMSGSDWALEGGAWQYTFLRSRANSIEGGTTEVQKNIIVERILGLPKG